MSTSSQTTSPSSPPSHVHIIGGGVGGLTLARVLQLSNIQATVYERETSATSRAQGGTLDMHTHSGQKALRIAGLYEQFEERCNRLADSMIIRGKDASVAFQEEPHEGGPPGDEQGPPPNEARGEGEDDEEFDGPPDDDRPEIDRGDLRQILLGSLKPDTVQWGHTLRSITPAQNGTHQLVFETHLPSSSPAISTTTVTAEFVVGADGAWSRTRSILSPAMPHYTGVIFIETELLDVDARHPAIAELVGDGTMMAIAEQKGLIVQRNSGGKMKVYITLRVPETWVVDSGIPFESDAQATRTLLLEQFKGWNEGLRDIIRVAEPKFIPRPLVCMDPEMKWEGKEGVTLLGDAAHVMSPFAGEGANLAMIDAAELGYALAGRNVKGEEGKYASVREAVAAYEKRMFSRAEGAAKESAMNMEIFISDLAPMSAANWMREMMAGGPGSR